MYIFSTLLFLNRALRAHVRFKRLVSTLLYDIIFDQIRFNAVVCFLFISDSGPTARSAGRSFPSLRYVPVLTHAQARAGSSGGAMSAPPCGMVDSSYLYSDEYDADNSGQTISTTKSSDYVYFKSPHNGNTIYDV